MTDLTRTSNKNPETKKTAEKDPTHGVFIGEVISTKDLSRTGRIQVFISALSKDKTNPSGRFDCVWTSPFAGGTDPAAIGSKIESYEQTQKSYGMWMVPPDIGNLVLVAFGDGNLKFPFIIGCLFPDKYNHMVPGMPSGKSYSDSTLLVPVAEKNKRDERTTQNDAIRPIHIDLAEKIVQQGLINDPIRGAGSSGARRESPSEVFGILTPGPRDPLNFNNRLAGHQFVMDDRIGNRLIRLRTAGAQQILMDDGTGIIYIINKEGTWVELNGKTINVFAGGDINMRAKGSFNLRADQDINIEAGQNLNLKAAGDNIGTDDYKGIFKDAETGDAPKGSGGMVNIEAMASINNYAMLSYNATAAVSDMNFSAAGALAITSGIPGMSINTLGTLGISAAMASEYKAGSIGIHGGTVGITGTPISLNSGPGAIVPSLPAKAAPRIAVRAAQDDQPSDKPVFNIDNAKDGKPSIPLQGKRPGTVNKIESIVPIMVTAEPYATHAAKPPDPAQDDQSRVAEDSTAVDNSKPGESANPNKPADVQKPDSSSTGVKYTTPGATGGTGAAAATPASKSASEQLKEFNAELEKAANSIPTYADLQNVLNNFAEAAKKELLAVTGLDKVIKSIETAIPSNPFPLTNAVKEKIVGVQKVLKEYEARLNQFGIDKLGLPADLNLDAFKQMQGTINNAFKFAKNAQDLANRLQQAGVSVTRDGPGLIYQDALGNKLVDFSNGLGPIGTSLGLAADLNLSYESVKRMIKVPLNDNQTSAIASFVQSIGPENFAKSGVLAALNEGKYSEIPRLMKAWSLGVDVGGGGTDGSLVFRPDLEARRIYEGEVFQTPDEVDITPPPGAPGDIGFLRLAQHVSNLRAEYVRQKLNEFGFS